MVTSLTEGLTVQVSALMVARGKSDRELDRLASIVSAMHEKMQALEANARERDGRMEQQFQQLRKAVEEMRMGLAAQGRP